MSQEKLEKAKNLFFIALGIDMAVTALVAITDLWAVGVLNDIRSGVITADQSTISILEFWESFAKVMILTLFGVGLALVRWLDACYEYAKENLKATGFAQEGWKTWGWIVPFINVFKPYQVLSEIYKSGAAGHFGGEEWKKSSGSGMLLFWWIFWVISHMVMWGIGKQAIKGAFRDDLTLDQIISMYYGSVTICIVSLIVAGLWYVVAGNLTWRLLNRSALVVGSVAFAQPPAAYASDVPGVTNSPSTIADEERVYAEIAYELEIGVADKGLWTRLFAECGGDERQTKVLYIKQRAERLLSVVRSRLEQPVYEQVVDSKQMKELDLQYQQHVLVESAEVVEIDEFISFLSANPPDDELHDRVQALLRSGYDKEGLVDLVRDRAYEALAIDLARVISQTA